MIEILEESLPRESDERLREWLSRSEYDTLVRVLTARVKAEEARSLNVQLDLDKYPNHAITSQEHMEAARRFRTTLEVLQEIRDRKLETPFTTVRLL